jgi:hypothetical protein
MSLIRVRTGPFSGSQASAAANNFSRTSSSSKGQPAPRERGRCSSDPASTRAHDDPPGATAIPFASSCGRCLHRSSLAWRQWLRSRARPAGDERPPAIAGLASNVLKHANELIRYIDKCFAVVSRSTHASHSSVLLPTAVALSLRRVHRLAVGRRNCAAASIRMPRPGGIARRVVRRYEPAIASADSESACVAVTKTAGHTLGRGRRDRTVPAPVPDLEIVPFVRRAATMWMRRSWS